MTRSRSFCCLPCHTAVEVTGEVYRSLKLEAEVPRIFHPENLTSYYAPNLVLAAENDVLFPGRAVIRRAQQVIPNLVAAELIAGSTHFVQEYLWGKLCEHINRFIQTNC